MDDRETFALLNLVGREIHVTKTNGCHLKGLFCASNPGPEDVGSFSMRYVTHVLGTTEPSTPIVYRATVKINWCDVESLVAIKSGGKNGWMYDPSTPSTKNTVLSDRAITDNKKTSVSVREELKAVDPTWLDTAAKGNDGGLGNKQGEAWNQFEVNREKFGLQNTYKAELYTTELNPKEFTPEQIKKASEIEKKIESKIDSGTTSVHTREERGTSVKKGEENEWNEESKFSAVIPRKQQQPMSWAKLVTTGTKKTTSEVSRLEEIRKFKEFSQTYQSPTKKPSIPSETIPPSPLSLEPTPLIESVQPQVVVAAATIAPSTTTAAAVPKKKLNPNAKNFAPTLGNMMSPQIGMMHLPPPQTLGYGQPKFYPMPLPMPPPGAYYPNMPYPPMQGMPPPPLPYGMMYPPSPQQRMYYPPLPQQKFGYMPIPMLQQVVQQPIQPSTTIPQNLPNTTASIPQTNNTSLES
jgi:hypothetical protein